MSLDVWKDPATLSGQQSWTATGWRYLRASSNCHWSYWSRCSQYPGLKPQCSMFVWLELVLCWQQDQLRSGDWARSVTAPERLERNSSSHAYQPAKVDKFHTPRIELNDWFRSLDSSRSTSPFVPFTTTKDSPPKNGLAQFSDPTLPARQDYSFTLKTPNTRQCPVPRQLDDPPISSFSLITAQGPQLHSKASSEAALGAVISLTELFPPNTIIVHSKSTSIDHNTRRVTEERHRLQRRGSWRWG